MWSVKVFMAHIWAIVVVVIVVVDIVVVVVVVVVVIVIVVPLLTVADNIITSCAKSFLFQYCQAQQSSLKCFAPLLARNRVK